MNEIQPDDINFNDYIVLMDSAISEISASGIHYKDQQGEHLISFEECAASFKKEYPTTSDHCIGERWSQDNPPNIVFYTAPLTTHVHFLEGNKIQKLFRKKSVRKRFEAMQKTISEYGYSTFDMS